MPYRPNIEQWEKYFAGQADQQLKGKSVQKKVLNATVKGGVSVQGQSAGLTKVGVVKSKVPETKTVNIEAVSPAEATVERAKSELDRVIKESTEIESEIYKETAKRSAAVSGEQPKRKRKKRRVYNDIFSSK